MLTKKDTIVLYCMAF